MKTNQAAFNHIQSSEPLVCDVVLPLSSKAWTTQDEGDIFLKMLGTTNTTTRCHSREDLHPQLYHCVDLTSHIVHYTSGNTASMWYIILSHIHLQIQW